MKKPPAWPIGITILLVLFAGANIQMMRIANDDPSFAVEPDYYRKAVAFDSAMAQERRSSDLGWLAVTRLDAGTPGRVAVTLTGPDGQPIRAARVTIDARFNARAGEVLKADLTESTPGLYSAPLAVKYAGEWEVRVDAIRGAEHYTASTRTQASTVK